jgi:hypothetical protein
MKFLVKIFSNIFKSKPKPVVVKQVELFQTCKIYAFGFKSQDDINYRYFRLKYKILKEGTMKHLSVYVDHIETLNKLTNKNWIIIVKEKH